MFLTRTSVASSKGFTLTELLEVILIIGFLSGLLLVVVSGAFESGRKNQAKSELAALSVGLEAYRNKFGDYPRLTIRLEANDPGDPTDEGVKFFKALSGIRGPDSGSEDLNPSFPPFLELGNFSLAGHSVNDDLVIHDPWGSCYIYEYPSNSSAGYMLYSLGPDQLGSLSGRGNAAVDTDNIHYDD